MREYIFNKYFGLCAQCGAPGEEVHHIEWLNSSNIYDYDIALGEDNLVLLCRTCHINKHRPKEITSKELGFDENGDLIQL